MVPVLAAAEGRAILAEDPTAILMGERWGKKIPGFHHNTSAIAASGLDVQGRQVVLSTTNGTLGMLGAQRAERVFLGCIRNAGAVVRRVAREARAAGTEVTLVPIGLAHGRLRAIEDELCAELLRRPPARRARALR